jgi:hypothetical protein
MVLLFQCAQTQEARSMPVRICRIAFLAACFVLACQMAGPAAVEILDAQYRPDRVLPEWTIFWKDALRWGDDLTQYIYKPSGAFAIYLRNTDGSPVTINDVTVDGGSLTSSKSCGTTTYKCSVPCGWKSNAALVAAGNPAWWHKDPGVIPGYGTAEVFIRMRTRVAKTVNIVVYTSAGSVSTSFVVDDSAHPRVAGYCTSPDYTRLYLYLRHPVKGKIPTSILVDGVDVTSSSTICGDSDYDLAPVEVALPTAFTRGSYHCFQAIYDDGSTAADGERIYYDPFMYGRWGSPPVNDLNDARFHIRDMGIHSMNLQVRGWPTFDGYDNDAQFLAYMDQYGIKTLTGAGGTRDYGPFLCDEPDAEEDVNQSAMTQYAAAAIGAMAQQLSDDSLSYKPTQAEYPTMINLDASFKPSNYYIYSHVPDIISLDPYYQTRIYDAYFTRPNSIATYTKATYVYAFANTCQAAKEPGRVHMTIASTRRQVANSRVFRWATPEEKRIEVYYCLAAGAKQISYWWFSKVAWTTTGSCGIGDADEPGSAALWREIGLLGAEIGIASQVLVNSCPVIVDVAKPGKLWTRTLISGTDTMVLICVNDDYSCDDTGTIIRGLRGVDVGMELPSWLNPSSVFDVSYEGISEVSYDVTGSRINLHLGKVGVTRMIVITSNSALKSTLQSLYTNTYRPRVAELIPLP